MAIEVNMYLLVKSIKLTNYMNTSLLKINVCVFIFMFEVLAIYSLIMFA